MKKNRGITLISLVITIIVLLILASIATYAGVNVIRDTHFTRFATALKITQTKVNEIYESYTNNKTIEVNGQKYTGNEILNIGKDISTVQEQANKVFTAGESGITDTTGYKYYDKFLVEALNIEGTKDEEFFINIEKRSVVSYDGMSYEGKNYYTLAQIPDGLYNVEYEDKNTGKPTFDASAEKNQKGSYTITISNIQFSGYIDKWQVKYQKEGQDFWSTSDNLKFDVNESGRYLIYIENGNVKSDIKNVETGPSEIPTSESYVGYYADIDGDKNIDGIIYADLAVGGSGTWNSDSWSSYEYAKVAEGLKSYSISSENGTGFGNWEKPIITAKEGTTGKDRFYVMALEDFNPGTSYCWYNAAYGKLDNLVGNTTNDFGQGKTNTTTMIDKWNSSGYGPQDAHGTYKDMWGVIQKADSAGKTWDLSKWFVPSKAEWAAFGDMTYTKIGLPTSNYGNYGLKSYYWSSAQNNTRTAWDASFIRGRVHYGYVNYDGSVRLSATF